jgi:quinol monooxygenase YgiN
MHQASASPPHPRSALLPVVVVATISPVREHREAVREAVLTAIPQVHAEPGCQRYALHEGRTRGWS